MVLTGSRDPGPAFPPTFVDLLPQSLPSNSCERAPGPGPRRDGSPSFKKAHARATSLKNSNAHLYASKNANLFALDAAGWREGLRNCLAGENCGCLAGVFSNGGETHRQSSAHRHTINTSGRISGGLERGKLAEPMPRAKPLQPSRQGAASSFHQWRLLLLVGVSAPAVPPTTAPAAAPRPPPRMAPAAAPPPAPMPTFLARLRLPLLLLFLLEVVRLEVVRLLEVAAIRGTAVSASSPKHRAAAHSDFFIDRPSRDKICNQSAKLRGVCNLSGCNQFRHTTSDSTGPQCTVGPTRLCRFGARRSPKT